MTDASPPPSFGFVKLVVRDMEAMLGFYDKVLGARSVRTIESDIYAEELLATPGMEKGPYVVLFLNKGGREITIGNGWGPVGFWVTGVDSAYRHALANGAKASQEPRDSNSFRVAYFFDPEGHEIEIVGTPG